MNECIYINFDQKKNVYLIKGWVRAVVVGERLRANIVGGAIVDVG